MMRGNSDVYIGEPLGVENGLLELRPQAHPPERILRMGVFNDTHCDQKLTKGSPFANREPVTLVIPTDFEHPPARDLSSKL
jgi:hypothetical protein